MLIWEILNSVALSDKGTLGIQVERGFTLQFTITLVQMHSEEGNRETNFKRARSLLNQHIPWKGVQFILLPELFAIGFRHADYKKEGPGVPGPTTDFICSIAEEHQTYTIGTGIEKSGEKFHNTLVMAKPTGEVYGTYSKIHPFQEERDVFVGGKVMTMFDCSGIKVGTEICYDVRFPEVTRKLALEGAEIVLIPAAFPDPRSAHWNTLIRARAIENQLYVAATNRIGFGFDGKTYFGHSQMVDPWGVVLTRLNSEERIITIEGDTDMIKSVRSQITCYADIAHSGYDNIQWFRE
ncbi:MAG: nitrilase-related carbon-nitrogen hydrolase [Candidatus Thorarchaeota archaeon]